jgi:hypothetical protein
MNEPVQKAMKGEFCSFFIVIQQFEDISFSRLSFRPDSYREQRGISYAYLSF